MRIQRKLIFALATSILSLTAASALASKPGAGGDGSSDKRDIYKQEPGFNGIEFGARPSPDMVLTDDSGAPLLIYARKTDSTLFGTVEIQPPQYHYHQTLGFYKATVNVSASSDALLSEELVRRYGTPLQVLPLGDRDLLLWLHPVHTVEYTRIKEGITHFKVASTRLATEAGDP